MVSTSARVSAPKVKSRVCGSRCAMRSSRIASTLRSLASAVTSTKRLAACATSPNDAASPVKRR